MAEATKQTASAVINVGDEILLGEMGNENQRWMLSTLAEHGRPAEIALCLPDDAAIIASWISTLADGGHEPICVSGGIGGTHDDHTREGIAQGLGVPLERHDECFQILADKYGDRFNSQRQRMAWLPQGSKLIANPLGAPGFHLAGVYAFPGFPTMMQPMMLAALAELTTGATPPAWVTKEHAILCAEGEIAKEVEEFALAHPSARLGIYPSAKELGRKTVLRLRCAPDQSATLADFETLVKRLTAERGD